MLCNPVLHIGNVEIYNSHSIFSGFLVLMFATFYKRYVETLRIGENWKNGSINQHFELFS